MPGPIISLGRILVLFVSLSSLSFQWSKVENIFRVVSSGTKTQPAHRNHRETNELSAALFRVRVAPFQKMERRRFELEDRLRQRLRAFDVIGVRRARNETIPPTFNRSSPRNCSVDDSTRSKEEEERRHLLPSQLLLPRRMIVDARRLVILFVVWRKKNS